MHYCMELAVEVRRSFLQIKPDCVAVEFPESMQDTFLHAASRLPDISVITTKSNEETLCFPVEPCDAAFEALRSAQEEQIPAFCIDLDVVGYPKTNEVLPDAYAITKIGVKDYYEAYARTIIADPTLRGHHDKERELYMAKRLRELSFSFDRILVVVGMSHIPGILAHLKDASYPELAHAERNEVTLGTYSEDAVRQMLGECGWISTKYEEWRQDNSAVIDRNELHYNLIKAAQIPYEAASRSMVTGQIIGRIFTFCRNWAHLRGMLLPDFVQLLSASKSCVDHNFAYEVWKLGTEYAHHKNIDSLPVVDLTPGEVWGSSRKVHFHLKSPSDKGLYWRRLRKDQSRKIFYPPNPFSICSYPPEDSVIENFGLFLKKKGIQQQTEEANHVVPFSNSLEDGVDVKETIRHWPEKKLYVRARGKPPGLVGSCVVIFDEDKLDETKTQERYPATMTWLGENDQESDMAFYATSMSDDVIGPGIARCEYGGFLLSFPARRMYDIWADPDYEEFEAKHEVLLAAAIDYSVRPVIVYAGINPPSARLKAHANRQGKRILYIPLTQFSQKVIQGLQTFHILDGQDKRKIADEYIY